MLHLKTVHNATFKLLNALISQDEIGMFSLAGGTALALQVGHRISVDLDFFTQNEFDANDLFECLRGCYNVTGCSQSVNSLSLFIKMEGEDIKVDFIRHHYPLLQPIRMIAKVRLFSLEDIAAMKLNAIANRGAKKDFFDIQALLNQFSLQDLLGFFEAKYEQLNSFTVIKSLTYFNDADLDPEPMSLVEVEWGDIKEKLRGLVKTSF